MRLSDRAAGKYALPPWEASMVRMPCSSCKMVVATCDPPCISMICCSSLSDQMDLQQAAQLSGKHIILSYQPVLSSSNIMQLYSPDALIDFIKSDAE